MEAQAVYTGPTFTEPSAQKLETFERDLASLINRHSLESGSNTPDFVLARYLVSCLKGYNAAVQHREGLKKP